MLFRAGQICCAEETHSVFEVGSEQLQKNSNFPLTEDLLCAIVINAVKQQSRVSTLTLARFK